MNYFNIKQEGMKSKINHHLPLGWIYKVHFSLGGPCYSSEIESALKYHTTGQKRLEIFLIQPIKIFSVLATKYKGGCGFTPLQQMFK